MNKNKKIFLIISIALVSIILLVGVTYALNYIQTGNNQQLILGDIWMKYEEKSGLTIEDAVPGSNYSNYFEFTISGTNTYTKKDIYYDFLITRGDLPADKSEDYRIPDKYLKFKLVSVDESDQETVLLVDQKYSSLDNKRIYVETIGAGVSDYSKTYRLYMTIDNSLLIGNSDDAIFTFSEWESAFASIKVNVTGDFTPKEIEIEATDEACFYTEETAFYTRNENMTEEELTLCETYFTNLVNQEDNYYAFYEDSTARSFCEGTGKIVSQVEGISSKDLYNFQDYLNKNYFEDDDLVNNNIVKKESGIQISYYDASCGTDVVIPSQINGNKVLRLRGFDGNSLTSVVISNGVRAIEAEAFSGNSLTSVTIPSSVFYVGNYAFGDNMISNLTIEDGVKVIGDAAFTGNQLTSVDLPDSVELYYCTSFDDNVAINASNALTCTNTNDNLIYSGGNG